jgi:hypothetical protein
LLDGLGFGILEGERLEFNDVIKTSVNVEVMNLQI